MRYLILAFILFVESTLCHAEEINPSSPSIGWYDLESAQQLARDSPRPLFIEFTAKWCGWCKKMDKTTFSDTKVMDLLNKDYYAVKVDFDSEIPIDYQGVKYTGKQLAKKFGIEGLPTMIYVPATLTGSKTIVGYKTSKQLIKELNKLNSP